VERSRDHRREGAGGSCPSAGVDPTEVSVSSFMGYLKGKSALMIFDRHANLKYKFGNRHFWSRGDYVSTVGLNEATIAKYVREQEKHDQMMDRISTKEAEDPFRGS
jgi:putative transposase